MSFHVRRKNREITDSDVFKGVLKSTKYVTVALCMDNKPYLVSLSHGYDEAHKCLYFHCAEEGKKIVYMKANRTVWGQAVLYCGVTEECDYAYSCVHFKGKISLIEDLGEKRHGMEVMVRQLSDSSEVKLAKIKPAKLAKTTMGRIDISYMTGKKHQPEP
jgi:nitroimidazol reductase NimA-like FMN-containing flavoprotein (pyridoxamine 5'-phosphate oxidase superfamily)